MSNKPGTNLYSATHVAIADGVEINCTDGYDGYTDADHYDALPVAIVVGQSGDVVVELLDGSELTLPAMPNGFTWNLQVNKVKGDDGSTTATDIVVLWNRRVQLLNDLY